MGQWRTWEPFEHWVLRLARTQCLGMAALGVCGSVVGLFLLPIGLLMTLGSGVPKSGVSPEVPGQSGGFVFYLGLYTLGSGLGLIVWLVSSWHCSRSSVISERSERQ